MVSQAGPDIPQLGDPGGDLLDVVHLANKEFVLQKVAEMRVAVSHPMGGEQTLVDLQLICFLIGTLTERNVGFKVAQNTYYIMWRRFPNAQSHSFKQVFI